MLKLIKIGIFMFCFVSMAQSKVGTIDVDFILSKMPELPTVQSQVKTYAESLDADFNKKMASYDALVKTYTEEEATFTIAQKKVKQTEILNVEDDLAKFQKNGTQLIGIKQDELLRPLYKKIGAALEKVAQTNGYTQVLQMDESVVYIDKNFDLTLGVLAELGITLSEEKK